MPEQESPNQVEDPIYRPLDDLTQRLNRLHYLELKPFQADIPEAYQDVFPILQKAADKVDEIFWKQAYGDKSQTLQAFNGEDLQALSGEELQKLILLNYGPYDRMDDNNPLVMGIKEKPPGANFYPLTITKRELATLPESMSKYTLIERDDKGKLWSKPYAEVYKEELMAAADFLRAAGDKMAGSKFGEFLAERALALENDQYTHSDALWLDLWDEPLDMLIGPIESYEDKFLGIKAGYQACIVLKDEEESKKIIPLVNLLSDLKMDLNAEIQYERGFLPRPESVGVYQALYFSGLFNAGSKSIGLNAPNFLFPKEVGNIGKRRLILKNIVDAKFQHIMLPIGKGLLKEEQHSLLSPDAFLQYVLFHELSHGWELIPEGKKLNGKSIQENLLQYASIIDEAKGDMLGLYMISQAYQQNLMRDGNLESHYVTSLINSLRAVRFGRNSAHAIANMIRLNFFLEQKAYIYDEDKKLFYVQFENMASAIKTLIEKVLSIQAEGSANDAMLWIRSYGQLSLEQEQILERVAHIPVDLRFQ